jgi:condensin complex subunit 3
MAPRSQKPNKVLENLHEEIAAVFEQVQVSLANHKKNCVGLYKIHTLAAAVVHDVGARKGSGVQFVGEEAFQDVFVDMVSRVLEVKKGNGAAGVERVVKFVGSFVTFMNEKGMLRFSINVRFC